MANTPQSRWFHPGPNWLLLGILAVEGVLFLSEQFQWFAFNSHKGWTVLIALTSVGIVLLAMLLWLLVALVFRLRFQFSIRTLLVLTLAAALPFSWLAVEMKRAREQGRLVDLIQTAGIQVEYDFQLDARLFSLPDTTCPKLRRLDINHTRVTDDGLQTVGKLTYLQSLWLGDLEITDVGLEHLKAIRGLARPWLNGTRLT